MTTITLKKKQVEKEIGALNDKLQEKIILAGIEIDSISDEEIVLDISPNRPDLLSMQGFLRFMKNYLGKAKIKEFKVSKPEKDYKVIIDKSVKDVRPYTACAIVKNMKFDESKIKEIIDIQEKLHLTIGRKRKKLAIGIYPLEKISLPITFEARKPADIKFIPLEMSEEMNGLQILQKHSAGREYGYLLDGKPKFPVFVDSKGKILSMPPIINSNETGKISEQTKEIFIECSGFNQHYLDKALNILTSVFSDMGGEICQMDIEDKEKSVSPDLSFEKIPFRIEEINKTLGLNLGEKEIKPLLEKMGIGYEKGVALIPAYRIDFMHWVDLAEDIAIAYGYENLAPEMSKVATLAGESAESAIESKISNILSGLGIIEVSSFHMIKDEEAKKENLKEADKIEVEDSKTDFKLLRPNLTIPAFRILSENKDNEYPQKIFEIGTVFSRDRSGKSETGINESKNLLIACSPCNFTEIKQIFDYLTRMLRAKYEIKEAKSKNMIEGRTGAISVNGREIGFIGEADIEALRKWNIKMPVSFLEIGLTEIFNLLEK